MPKPGNIEPQVAFKLEQVLAHAEQIGREPVKWVLSAKTVNQLMKEMPTVFPYFSFDPTETPSWYGIPIEIDNNIDGAELLLK
jgi:hypothetical protein